MEKFYDETDFDSLIDDLSSDTLTFTTEEDSVSDDRQSKPVNGRGNGNKICRRPRKNRYSPEPLSDSQVVVKPRILRTDIRRSYAIMLANVINSGDFPLMYGLLETFFNPSFEHVVVKHKPEDDTAATYVRQGLTNIATNFYAIMNIDPDPVVTIKETKIHLISNTTASKIVAQWSYSATSVYERVDEDDQCPRHGDHAALVEAAEKQNPFDVCCTAHKRKEIGMDPETELRQQTIDTIANSIETLKKALPRRETPLPFSFGGKLTLYTDENKVITRMEMEMFAPEEVQRMGMRVFDKGAIRVT